MTDFKIASDSGKNQKRVYIDEFKGKTLLHIREWYEDKETTEYKPSPKGITFKVEEIDNLITALTAVKNELPKAED